MFLINFIGVMLYAENVLVRSAGDCYLEFFPTKHMLIIWAYIFIKLQYIVTYHDYKLQTSN